MHQRSARFEPDQNRQSRGGAVHAHARLLSLELHGRHVRRRRAGFIGRARRQGFRPCTLEERQHRTAVRGYGFAPVRPVHNQPRLLRSQIPSRGVQELLARRRQQTLHVPIPEAPVAERFPLREIVGLAFHVLQAAHPS